MQVAIFTGSREAEKKMLGVIDELSKFNVGIEARVLSKCCTREDLKIIVEDSLAEVFLVGSSAAKTLSAHIANFADSRPVIGVPLENVNDELLIYNEEPLPNNACAIMDKNDIIGASQLAGAIITNLQDARS